MSNIFWIFCFRNVLLTSLKTDEYRDEHYGIHLILSVYTFFMFVVCLQIYKLAIINYRKQIRRITFFLLLVTERCAMYAKFIAVILL